MLKEKRLRVFAGPNGSGKSTIFHKIKSKFNSVVYLNADEIEKRIKDKLSINLNDYNLDSVSSEKFNTFVKEHSLNKKAQSHNFRINLHIKSSRVFNPTSDTNSYEASILVDFIRNELINSGEDIAFETVMSHFSKIDILKKSAAHGYKNYLYFISTDSVIINKLRVEERVKNGGHPVPVDKIDERYYKSLQLLKEAISHTYRTFIFDNSGSQSKLILDVYKGNKVTYSTNKIPKWVDMWFLNP